MSEILGNAKTVREILKGIKYSIDYYQREYKWEDKHIEELVADLSGKFLEGYRPGHEREKAAEYPHYFLGSIIINKRDGTNYVVDGQQRLTSLTLLLIYLRNLQAGRSQQVNVDELVFSERFGKKSFNLNVEERTPCMEALFEQKEFDATGRSESVQNILARYEHIEECLPEELRGDALPFFIDWLLENVHLVEITAYSDEDAYTVFETMNDRGLSLSPTEMLKGYLLTNISDLHKRRLAEKLWKDRVAELAEEYSEGAPDFFKAWLRSQYATKIREREKGARPENFDQIGTEFHRWLREASGAIGLKQADNFYWFIDRDFNFYSRQYLILMKASVTAVDGLEHVLYNTDQGFTLQYMLLLSPLRPEDDAKAIVTKLRLVGRFIDITLARRIWNFRSIAYSTMQYAMFLVMREIRGLPAAELASKLIAVLDREQESFANNDRLRTHQQNHNAVRRLLARITDYVEQQSGQPARYHEYMSAQGRARYEVEHIWADHPERHTDEFGLAADFVEYRNRIGGLLLLPKSFNASFGDLSYSEKLPHYNSQNLLARSLNQQCYQLNPGFLRFVHESKLPFQPHSQFNKADLEERSALYRQIAERIWDPDDLLRELSK